MYFFYFSTHFFLWVLIWVLNCVVLCLNMPIFATLNAKTC
nr:MAG TPA: hypothetical protein [Caudoviricetes sp.]